MPSQDLADRLFDMKIKIDDAKAERNRVEGGLAEAMKRLKVECGCETVDDAKAKIAALNMKISALEKREQSLMDLFDKKYEAPDNG